MARRHGSKNRYHFEFGDTVWWSYSGEYVDYDKNGIKRTGRITSQLFTLPEAGIYTSDSSEKKMIISNATTDRKKLTTDSFRNTLKLLTHKLDKKDKKNGDSNLITQLTKMFPQSPYYVTNPEWFV